MWEIVEPSIWADDSNSFTNSAALSGVASVDGVRVAHLIELAVDFAQHHMKREGALVVKLFHGSGYNELVQLFKANFHTVKTCKPKASRPQSAETFLIGMGLKTV